MFERLQQKWKVSGLKLAIIIITFAIGGSLTGYVGKKIMNLSGVEKGPLWIIIYVLLITLIWPIAVLAVSIPFGQFYFFKNYIRKMGVKMGIGRQPAADHSKRGKARPVRMAIFASGTGTNAQKIIDHFRNHPFITVSLIVCNKPGAGVLSIAEKEKVPSLLIDKEKFFRGDAYIPAFTEKQIDFIILAGFLWKIPVALIKAFPNRIINIHPALLPKYGGRGMYGHFVHEAVIASGDKESGITVHYVDEIYDHGKIILQEKCTVTPTDTAESLAQKIHALEHKHYPPLIEQLLIK